MSSDPRRFLSSGLLADIAQNSYFPKTSSWGQHKADRSNRGAAACTAWCRDCGHPPQDEVRLRRMQLRMGERPRLANRNLIGPLMHDVGFRMDSTQQSLVSAWALKTTIVAESIRRHGRIFYTKAECEQFRSALAIPPLTTVWLARYTGENDLGLYGTYLWEGRRPDDPKALPGRQIPSLSAVLRSRS